jgi:transposase InsO family protein
MRAYTILPTQHIKAASLSPEAHRRLWWMDWYGSHGRNAEKTCRHFGISKSVFYRWKTRYNPKNLKTLEDDKKTRRPHHIRSMTTAVWIIKKIYDIRKDNPEKSKYEIQEELRRQGVHVGQSAIQKVINRHPELHNSCHKNRMKMHRSLSIARVKAARELREKYPGSLVQVDTQYFYVLKKKLYLFSAVDCRSRYGFVWAYATISSASARDFVQRLRAYVPFPIAAINTDNGSEYLLHFHKELEDAGIPHYFSDPHCPKQNGRVERFHQTVEYEYFAYQDDLLPDLTMINQRCTAFNAWYNTERFHRALQYKTPQECVTLWEKTQGGQPFSI